MTTATILLVEDDGILAAHLEDVLTEFGYRVLTPVATGEEAIFTLQYNQADLVLMDIELAGEMNGIETALIIKHSSDIPIIFLTSYSQDPLLEQAKAVSPYGYLIKPVPERELAATIKMGLHRYALDRQLIESQKALALSEAKYRRLFEDSPLGIFRTDLDGRLLLANAELAKMIGWSSPEEAVKELSNVTKQLYVEPAQRDEFIELLRRGGEVRHFECQIRKKDGEFIWLNVNARLMSTEDTDGDNSIIDGFAQDITERRKARQLLRESEEKFRSLTESSTDYIMRYDRHHRHTYMNPAALKVSGLCEDDIIGKTHLEAGFPEDLSRSWEKKIEQVFVTAAPCQSEFSWESARGKVCLDWRLTPEFDAEGRVYSVLGVSRDITERKSAEEALRTSEANFRTFFSSMSDMVVVTTIDGTILTANEMVVLTLGFDLENLTGTRFKELITSNHHQEAEFDLVNLLENPTAPHRFVLQTKSGDPVPVVLRAWQGQWNGLDCIYCSCRNLSAQEEAEQRFECLFRHNPALMALNSMDGGLFVDVNDAWLEAIGYSNEEVIGRSSQDLELFPDIEQYKLAGEELRDTGRLVDRELRIRCKDGSVRHGLFSGEKIRIHGQFYFLTVMIDITERKRIEAAMEKRILSLSQPLDDASGISIEDLFNLDELQLIQDQFAEATGVASLITYPDGRPITRPSNFSRLCAEIIRSSEVGLARCRHSDNVIGRDCFASATVQPCLSAGLWDAGAAITVGGQHIANWLIGQVRDETQTEEAMRDFAREIGVDETDCVEAFREVPVMLRKQFARVAQVLFTLATQLSTSAYQNVQQARFITERKKVEEALRASRERLHSLFRVAPIGIAVVRERVLLEVNKRICEMTGYAPEELIDQNARMLYPRQEDYDLAGTALYGSNTGKAISEVETRWRRKDGTVIDILIASTPLDPNDGIKGTLFTALDITERKRAESLLRASEGRYRELVECANSIILRMDNKGRLTFYNEYAQRFFGYASDEVVGKDVVGTIVPETESSGRNLREMIAEIGRDPGRYATNENENMLHDGTRVWISWTNRPFHDEAGEVREILCVGNDITARKHAEEEKRQLQAQLLQSQKLEAIGTLAGGIAHDFNNILAAVIGYADMAREHVAPGTTLAKDLDQVLNAGGRARDLVKQILAFSHQGDTDPISFYPAVVIKEAIKLLRPSLPSTIAIKQNIDPKAGPVCIDPTQMHQILMNLCTNAYHAMEEQGGALEIVLRNVDLNTSALAGRPHLRPGSYIELTIGDNGQGIAPEVIDRIFDPFFTTKGIGKGTGMGLSIVHGIAKSCSGFVTVESILGRGTAFHVFLPVAASESPAKDSSEDSVPLGSERILFIDDEEVLTDLAKTMLERLGYLVTVRNNSLEGLTTFQNHPDRFDLVITDQTMPGMTGMDLSRRLLRIRPNLPIILCTGFSALVSEEKAKAIGIRALAHKPLTKKDIASLIRNVLSD